MEQIEYERTWCDYLTPCPHFPEMMVGSYECFEECAYCSLNQPNMGHCVNCEYEDFLQAGRDNSQYFRKNPSTSDN